MTGETTETAVKVWGTILSGDYDGVSLLGREGCPEEVKLLLGEVTVQLKVHLTTLGVDVKVEDANVGGVDGLADPVANHGCFLCDVARKTI
jgi:hypothetical protein